MRRLSLLCTGLARGGAEAQVSLLARSFHARGWRVEVISMLRPEAHSTELEAAGIQVRCLHMRPGLPDPRAIIRLAAMLRRSQPHVLHCHMVHANLLGRIVRVLVRTPALISTAHSLNEGRRWREWAYRVTDPLCDLSTHVSLAGVERYRSIGAVSAEKIRWVRNGLDTAGYRRDVDTRRRVRTELGHGERFFWLAVGNLRAPKDYPSMLRAVAALSHCRTEHVVMIAGAGASEGELQNLTYELGISQRVRWLGSRTDIAELMSAADGFVMSSRWEGTPMALLEAAANELPVVATRVGGIPEVVEDDRSGYLVPPGRPDLLAGAMIRIMNLTAEQRGNMGRAGRDRVSADYGIHSVANTWEGIYEELLARPAGAPEVEPRSEAAPSTSS